MKFLIHVSLALLTIVGLVHGAPSAYSDPVPFNVNSGPYSSAQLDQVYALQDCEGVAAWCQANPIPINSIDVENGREITGYEIICDDLLVGGQGSGTGVPSDERVVPRAFGKIVIKYAPPAGTPPPAPH